MGIWNKIRGVFGLTDNSTEENDSSKQTESEDDNLEQSSEVGGQEKPDMITEQK